MTALEAYRQLNPPSLIGQVNTIEDLTQMHISLANLGKAEEYTTEALAIAKWANYAIGEGNALSQLGSIYLAVDKVLNAKQAYEQALAIANNNNSTNRLIDIDQLAWVYIQLDQLSDAEALLTTSAKVELDVVEIPIILATLGWLYICGDHIDRAEPLLDDTLQRFRKFDCKDWQAQVLAHLGTVYFKSNQLDDSEQVLKSIPDLGLWINTEIHRWWVLGDLYTLRGEFEDAEASLDAALAWCRNRQLLYSYQQGNVLRSMGTLHVKRGRVDLAIDKFQEAREFHHKAQWVSEQATDLKRLSEAYKMLGRTEEAEVVFEEAEVLMETIREARTLKA